MACASMFGPDVPLDCDMEGLLPAARTIIEVARLRTLAILAAVPLVGVAVVHRLRGAGHGVHAHGGVKMGDARRYDAVARLLFRSFYRGVATDVALAVPRGDRVLEVGCGSGRLATELACRHGLDVTGVDLDPAMIGVARAHVGACRDGHPRPAFAVGDAASLPFPDASFDVVVSTLSMHHWADPAAGLAEIARVLRPSGRALIWDLRPGSRRHAHVPDPSEHLHDARLRMAATTPWTWPWRFTPAQRIELVREGSTTPSP